MSLLVSTWYLSHHLFVAGAAVRTIIETDGLLERLAVGARTTHLRTAEEEFAELLALYERLIDSH